MTNEKAKATATDKRLRELFRKMPPAQVKEISEAFYDVLGGLQTLKIQLELADLDYDDAKAGPLLEEYMLAITALEIMKRSRLGAVL